MMTKVLDNFDFFIDPENVKKRICFKEKEDIELIESYCAEAQGIARPKIALAESYIDGLYEKSVDIGGVVFESGLLADNLSNTRKVVLYILTCGREIYEWAEGIDDFIGTFVVEEIKIEALRNSSMFFNQYIKTNIFAEKSSMMNPGSLPDWPIEEQKKLFALLDGPAKSIGVELTDSCLMVPNKSVSGIVFQKEESFINCMLCKRKGCPSRIAEYQGAVKKPV